MSVFLVCLGAAFGAGARQLLAAALPPTTAGIPRATMLVNMAGSFILGLLVASNAPTDLILALGVGFCGALTTWSTLSYDVLDVTRRRGAAVASALLIVSVTSGLLCAAVGYGIGTVL
ncbi:fluoride efflux transporter FluC [Nocardioides sp. Bht2]|uniref:fluoride efflux transporter FluC n=1 Tax=Nocardioides sp. Bht2 TaxID=3392297 RepID=UPI0039B66926